MSEKRTGFLDNLCLAALPCGAEWSPNADALSHTRARFTPVLETILENLVPNPTAISDLSAQHINPRTGRKARRRTLPSDAPARIKTLLSTSLPHIGPKLFNNLPGKLRNLTECSVEKFKHHLDNHLQTIPDEPPVPGYPSVSRADTNSISDQANLQHRDAGFRCSGGAPRL
ncbi:hypothetical protein GWK47_002410 [Chionoecetes opilio]|uniref:Uncharacterized protein n=1 Tax=Chionoecetes opilio TaxID=41210 RepID=A0A8J4XNI9_CHIOP|nr:hypothetical protein GWK47_002410 [Chionoecetes opilio]